jgi:hypothetical protein
MEIHKMWRMSIETFLCVWQEALDELMQVQMLSPALAIQVLHQVKKEQEQAFAL